MTDHSMAPDADRRPAAVVIGRNEGERLIRCLASISGQVGRLVYVDSGSTDGSVAAARAIGAEVVILDMAQPFTAARARNAGLDAVSKGELPDWIQFVDGDCELRPGWIEKARAFLETNPKAAVTFGRLRERFPEASIYNRLCDREWNTPVGEALACGGIAMMRRTALDQVGGFNPALIAGEEPEMCVRLRKKGWQVWRIDAEMALHDAAMKHFAQWWRRARRGGHAFAEGAALHGSSPDKLGVVGQRRALAWGLGLPIATLLGLIVTPWSFALLLFWPVQVIRLAARENFDRQVWGPSLFLVLGKIPEAIGVAEYWGRRLIARPTGIIEYK